MQSGKFIHFLFFFIISFGVHLFAQNKNSLGISCGADKAATADIRPISGISYERIIQKHHSVEIGIYYRLTMNDNLIVYIPQPPNSAISEQFFILEKFISVPLLYNYKSKAVNISVGPTVDIYIGWEEKKHVVSQSPAPFVILEDYKFDNKIHWGAIAKVSKTFDLNGWLVLEPYIYANPVFTPYSLYSGNFSETRQYYGAVVTLKYAF